MNKSKINVRKLGHWSGNSREREIIFTYLKILYDFSIVWFIFFLSFEFRILCSRTTYLLKINGWMSRC